MRTILSISFISVAFLVLSQESAKKSGSQEQLQKTVEKEGGSPQTRIRRIERQPVNSGKFTVIEGNKKEGTEGKKEE